MQLSCTTASLIFTQPKRVRGARKSVLRVTLKTRIKPFCLWASWWGEQINGIRLFIALQCGVSRAPHAKYIDGFMKQEGPTRRGHAPPPSLSLKCSASYLCTSTKRRLAVRLVGSSFTCDV